MGSEEFAIGRFPHEVVSAIRSVSREVDAERRELPPRAYADPEHGFDRERAGIAWAEHSAHVRCVVAISSFGGNARKIYRRRKRKPLVIITNEPATARYLQLFGAHVVLVDYDRGELDHTAIVQVALRKLGWTGTDESALLVVRHRVSKTKTTSKIEEVPLPT
ncbi:MAG: hypothetical protein JKY65_00285 [Planctomycetes bacterium]|nr:hypothetical protein [Planctomycetota bacterium]